MKMSLLANSDVMHLKAFKGGFLNLGTIDILDQIILCWGSGGGHRGFLCIVGCFAASLASNSLDVALIFQL